ncbi:MAG: hypothetical protein H6602_12595 [Flavobacteriales bacterium]|nr:hypothetical protein [Flavobacteriales bacterium]MCB9192492.1 hypothetical protein [Flavobacteriales bacterium]
MRKLTPEEYAQMNLRGRGRRSAFAAAVLRLEVDEVLYLPKEEWKKTYHPSQTIYTIKKRYNRKFELLTEVNDKGWTVRRLK